jgi:hypothetical protein
MDDEKQTLIYSWGPLYETLKEMKENGDDHQDEKLRYAFQLFEKLDKVETIVQIRKIILDGLRNISSDEQKRWNSPCFDGIVETIHFNSPIQKILEKHPQHVEAFKYYLLRTPEKRRKELFDVIRKYDRANYVQILLKSVELSPIDSCTIIDRSLNSLEFLREFVKCKNVHYNSTDSTISALLKFGIITVEEICYHSYFQENAILYILRKNMDISFLDRTKVINKESYKLLFSS